MRVKVLIIDDSATMRSGLKLVLQQDPEIEVVGAAKDPYEARELIKSLNPDVLTLDVEMPRMNGIDFLRNLMRLRPMPVVMVSSHTRKGADLAVQSLALGAFDCVGKPAGGDFFEALAELPLLVKRAARSRSREAGATGEGSAPEDRVSFANRYILIGASTGGVEAISKVLSSFPRNCPATAIVQHMPAGFTESFVSHLDRTTAPRVKVAAPDDRMEPGVVLVAPGSPSHMAFSGATPRCTFRNSEKVNGHRPSVDVLFNSAEPYAKKVVAGILTGLGVDGAAGLATLREAGARTVGQSKETCVVYGMPRAAAELGAIEHLLPINAVGPKLLSLCAQDANSERKRTPAA